MNKIIFTPIPVEELINAIVDKLEARQSKQSSKKYLSIKEACSLLGIATSTLHRYFNDGLIKRHYMGGKTLVSMADIENALSI